jgi:hypothetical protein
MQTRKHFKPEITKKSTKRSRGMRVLIVFLAIFALSFLGLIFFRIITGKAILPSSSNPVDNAPFSNTRYCNDSDGGVFFGVKGSVLYNHHGDILQYNDSCDDLGRNLIEYYCKGKSYAKVTKLCKNGCVDGACISDNAVEKCYLEFEINESKIDDSTRFSINKIINLYGSYDHLTNLYSSEYPEETSSFIIVTKNRAGAVLKKYSAESSRFVFWDDFSGTEPSGGIEELNESAFRVIVPFDADLYSLAINDTISEKITNLRLLRAPSCKRTCKLENEGGKWGEIECCAGLQAVQKIRDYTRFVCINCGDGICSENEDAYSCSEDCMTQ